MKKPKIFLILLILYSIISCSLLSRSIFNYNSDKIYLCENNFCYNQFKTVVDKSTASWYDYELDGIWYSKDHATAASRFYKRGTILNVSYNNKTIKVRVNDYGPEEWTGRQLDLSSYAFKQLAPLSKGLIEVIVYEN